MEAPLGPRANPSTLALLHMNAITQVEEARTSHLGASNRGRAGVALPTPKFTLARDQSVPENGRAVFTRVTVEGNSKRTGRRPAARMVSMAAHFRMVAPFRRAERAPSEVEASRARPRCLSAELWQATDRWNRDQWFANEDAMSGFVRSDLVRGGGFLTGSMIALMVVGAIFFVAGSL